MMLFLSPDEEDIYLYILYSALYMLIIELSVRTLFFYLQQVWQSLVMLVRIKKRPFQKKKDVRNIKIESHKSDQ